MVFCTQQRLNKWQLVKFSNLKQRIQYTPCKQRGAWTVKTELSFPKGAGIDRMVVHAYNSRTWEVLKFKGRLGYIIIPCLKKINKDKNKAYILCPSQCKWQDIYKEHKEEGN